MTINGLALPEAFVIDIQQGILRRSRGSWQLLNDVDAWGKPLETGLDEVFEAAESLKEKTR